jgi:hypothetical protein
LPQNWAEGRKRRRKPGVPEEISFKTKPESALKHLREGRRCVRLVLTGAGSDAETHLCTNIPTTGLSGVGPHATEHHDLAVRHGVVAAQKMVGPRAITEGDAPRPQSEVCRHIHAAMLNRKTVAAQEFMRQ